MLNKVLLILAQVLIAMITEAILRKQDVVEGANVNEEIAVQAMVTAAKLAIEAIPHLPFYVKPFLLNDQMLRSVAKSVADLVEELIAKGLDLANTKK